MKAREQVYNALKRCRGAFATIRAIASIAHVDESVARRYLVELEEKGLADVVQVFGDKHGARLHRCNAYMLVVDND